MRIRRFLAAGLLLAAARAFAASAEPSLVPDFGKAVPAPHPEEASPATPEPTLLPVAPAAPAAPLPAPAKKEEPPAPAAPPRPRNVQKEEMPREEAGARRPWILVRERVWYAAGSVNARENVQVPPNLVNPPGTEVFTGETDDFNAKGFMFVESAEIAPLSWLSFEAQYGSDRHKGNAAFHLWVHAPDATTLTYNPTGAVWHNPNHEDDEVESADLSAWREWVSGTVYVRVVDADVRTLDYLQMHDTVDVGLGAERYRQNSHLKNLAVTSNAGKYYAPGVPPGPIAGFDSTYNATWKGAHLALRGEVAGRDGFSLESLVLYDPFMLYEGDGFNNLAPGLQSSSPNFVDTAHGTAVHFQVGAAWNSPYLRLEAGYQRLYFFSRTGSRVDFNADGTTTTVTLDFATAELAGVYAGAALKF